MVNGKKVKVNVLGTTYEAFSSLIKFIYNVPEYLPPIADVQKLNDIVTIAKRYQVKQLAKEVQMVIARFHIKIESDIHLPVKEENTLDDPLRIENTFTDPIKAEHILVDDSFSNIVINE